MLQLGHARGAEITESDRTFFFLKPRHMQITSYEIYSLWTSQLMKFTAYEIHWLWNVLPMKCLACETCLAYEMPFYEMSKQRNSTWVRCNFMLGPGRRFDFRIRSYKYTFSCHKLEIQTRFFKSNIQTSFNSLSLNLERPRDNSRSNLASFMLAYFGKNFSM